MREVEKECSGWKNIEKLISGDGDGGWGGTTPIRHSRVGTKFRLKTTLEVLDEISTKWVFPN